MQLRILLAAGVMLAAGAGRAEAECGPQAYGPAPGAEALAVPAQAPRVLLLAHTWRTWTCAEDDAIVIELDQHVRALQVHWVDDGVLRETIVEADLPHDDLSTAPRFQIGKRDCDDANIPREALQAGAIASIRAVRFDGSVTELEGLPPSIYLDELPRFARQAPGETVLVAGEAAPSSSSRRRGTGGHGGLALMLLGGAFVIGARAARTREPADELPPARARR